MGKRVNCGMDVSLTLVSERHQTSACPSFQVGLGRILAGTRSTWWSYIRAKQDVVVYGRRLCRSSGSYSHDEGLVFLRATVSCSKTGQRAIAQEKGLP